MAIYDLARIHNVARQRTRVAGIENHKGLVEIFIEQDSLGFAFGHLSHKARNGQGLFASILGRCHIGIQVAVFDC